MEGRGRIEPPNKGFADLCLTTWLPRRRFQDYLSAIIDSHNFKREQIHARNRSLREAALPLFGWVETEVRTSAHRARLLEARTGVEPVMEVLQTSALPL